MALAIKAIPTLYGEDAIRFREEMENFTEKHFFCVYTKGVMEEC